MTLIFGTDGPLFNVFRTELLVFAVLQGFLMVLQNSYQARRSYVRKTLGKAQQIDVDSSETIVEKPTDLKILIPLLFLLYVVEMYFGVRLGLRYWSHTEEYECLVSSLAFTVLSIGNSLTTGVVLLSKKQSQQLARLLRTRPRLDSQ